MLKRENCVKDGRKKKACREIEWSHYEILPDIQSDFFKKKRPLFGDEEEESCVRELGKKKKKKEVDISQQKCTVCTAALSPLQTVLFH